MLLGLPLPSDNFLVQQLLLNYLPTSISTIIEPFWVVLNRLLCLFQPFDQLRRGNAPPSTTLNLRYSSIPPQLVFWRALRAKHFLLAAVCGMALMANVLTIALSGLFNQSFVYVSKDLLLRQLHVSTTEPRDTWHHSGFTLDNFYVADSNISTGTPLPPWVTPDRYFVPFELPLSTDTGTRYQGITTGVMAELQCEEMHKTQGNHLLDFTLSDDATFITLSTSHHQTDGGILRCQPLDGVGYSSQGRVPVAGNPEGIKAAEILTTMVEYNGTGIGADISAESAFCRTQILAGWIRSNITREASASNNTVHGSTRKTTSVAIDQMFMVCGPRFNNASFEITVDNLGTVLDSRPANSNLTTTNITALFSVSDNLKNAYMRSTKNFVWHNDTLATEWSSYLIKQLARSPAILDPHAPVPLFASTAALFSEVYSRTFAILVSVNSVWTLAPASSNVSINTIPAKAITGHWRIFMNPTMFKLAIIILSLDLLVAAWLYAARPTTFLPRMPTSLAAVIASFAAGEVVRDLKTETGKGAKAVSVEEQMAHLESKRWRFGYGKLFPGKDGRSHFGIERVPFFTPLQADDGADEKSGGLRLRFGRIWRPGRKS